MLASPMHLGGTEQVFRKDCHMTANEAAIRKAYHVAENKDITAWVNCFTEDGTFTDESIGVTSIAASESFHRRERG